jgi:hypothetical protein
MTAEFVVGIALRLQVELRDGRLIGEVQDMRGSRRDVF